MTNNTNPFEKDSYELKQIFNNLVKYKFDCESKIKAAEEATGFSNGMAFKPLEKLTLNLQSFDSIRNQNRSWNQMSLTSFEEKVTKDIESFRSYLESVKPERDIINAHNNQICANITNLMAKIGITVNYDVYEFKTNRSKERTRITKTSGFYTDLIRVKPSDNWTTLNTQLIDYERRFKEYLASEKQKEIKESESNYKLAVDKFLIKNTELSSRLIEYSINLSTFIAKHKENPNILHDVKSDIDETIEEKLSEILKQDKYLYLAYFMKKNRGDWSDGTHYASIGLNNFKIETEKDSDIYDCVSKLINEWDGDGRCFRDCEYSYDILYEMVDVDIMSKYTKLDTLHEEWIRLV